MEGRQAPHEGARIPHKSLASGVVLLLRWEMLDQGGCFSGSVGGWGGDGGNYGGKILTMGKKLLHSED